MRRQRSSALPNRAGSLLLFLFGVAWAMWPLRLQAQTRPTCSAVMSEVNRHVEERRGRPAGVVAVARRMGTDVAWVERCMRAYGRVPAERLKLDDEDIDELEEAIEGGDDYPLPPGEGVARTAPKPVDKPRRLKMEDREEDTLGGEFSPVHPGRR